MAKYLSSTIQARGRELKTSRNVSYIYSSYLSRTSYLKVKFSVMDLDSWFPLSNMTF